MGSNLRLLIVGLAAGLLSAFYPRLPRYLPPSVASYLPFLSVTFPSEAQPWTSYQRYQSTVPIIENHDPYADKLPPSERRMRMGSKIDKGQDMGEGGVEEGERGIESAGLENDIGMELPVYFVELASNFEPLDPNSSLAKTYARIGNEITSIVRPSTIVILSPLRSKSSSLSINSSPLAPLLYSHLPPSTQSNMPYTPSFSCAGSPDLAARLLDTFALVSPPISSLAWSHGLDPASWSTLIGLFGSKVEAKVVQVSIPFGVKKWTANELIEVGKALREVRDEGGVIIGVGVAKKERDAKFSTSYLASLNDALVAHTSIPREESLEILLSTNPPSVVAAANPNLQAKERSEESIPPHLLSLFALIGAAEEGEAESMDAEGGSWRFGRLPMRRA